MTRKECLDEAAKCVLGDRDKEYGPPEDSFGKIANLWSAYLGKMVTPREVADMMVLLKVARGTLASYPDIAGYAACAAEIIS